MRGSKILTPYWAQGGANSWNNTNNCSFFMPCDGVSNGQLLESKHGARLNPQPGFEFIYDATLFGVRSTGGYDADVSTMEGNVGIAERDKFHLFMHAGYMSATVHADTGTRDLRCSLGADGSRINFGLADANSHCIYTDYVGLIASRSTGVISTGDTIYSSIGTNFFVRYALTRPDVPSMEAQALDENGNILITNTFDYSSGIAVETGELSHTWRMCGSTNVGIGMISLTTVPSNYLELILIQALEWKRGNKVILKQWDL